MYIACGAEIAEYVKTYTGTAKKYYLIQGLDLDKADPWELSTYQYPLQKLVVSKWLANVVKKHSASNPITIRNGFDTKLFRIKTPIEARSPKSLSVMYHPSPDKGFDAAIDLEKPEMVFFSVPYEKGWSATVNGKPAAILKTNVGFMAVACPAGENVTVRFTYRTPGLRLGGVISAAALLILILYLFCCIRPNRRIRREAACPPPPPPAREPERTPEPPRPAPTYSDDNSAGEDDFDLYTFYPPARK